MPHENPIGRVEPPRLLVRETAPAEPYPVEHLGNLLGSAAKAIHERTQAPMALCAQSVLAAATLAVQAHADVELPTGQARPVSGFFVTVAASGERKTACDEHALWPIKKREKALYEEYHTQLLDWENDNAAWESQRKQILADKQTHGGQHQKKAALADLGPAPKRPLLPVLVCGDPTYEGLVKLLAVGHPSIGVFSSEGGSFIGGHGMSVDAKLRTASGMSTLWDGEPIKRVRSVDGTSVLPGRRVSLHLMAQPDVSAILLSDALLADQGLLSRVLVAAPESTAGTRRWLEPTPESEAAIRRYGARLLEIIEGPLPLAEDKINELAPRRLPLCAVARADWIRFVEHVETLIGPNGAMEPIKGLANKLPEHAARIAAVLALVEDIDAPEVPASCLKDAVVIVQYYATEALRLFESGMVDPDLRLADQLLKWLHGGWAENLISLPDVYQLGPNRIREQRSARKLVNLLAAHGWLEPVEGGAKVKGQRRHEVWRIVGGEA